MPMPYWITNHGGLHADVHHHSLSTPLHELRRDLPPDLAALPDAAIPDVWAAWQLLRHGHPLDEVARLFEFDDQTRQLLAYDARPPGASKPRSGQSNAPNPQHRE